MTAPKPETVAAMRAAMLLGVGRSEPVRAAVVADRLVADAVTAERTRIAELIECANRLVFAAVANDWANVLCDGRYTALVGVLAWMDPTRETTT